MLLRIRILLVLTFASTLLLGAACEKHPTFNIQEVSINSVNDYLNLCRVLVHKEKPGIDSQIRASSCLAYMRGLLDGYMATLSIRAEYDVAKEKGINSELTIEQIEGDDNLHDLISENMFHKYFLCYGSEYLYDLTVKLIKHIESLNIDREKENAHYILMSELKKLYPCPEKINYAKDAT